MSICRELLRSGRIHFPNTQSLPSPRVVRCSKPIVPGSEPGQEECRPAIPRPISQPILDHRFFITIAFGSESMAPDGLRPVRIRGILLHQYHQDGLQVRLDCQAGHWIAARRFCLDAQHDIKYMAWYARLAVYHMGEILVLDQKRKEILRAMVGCTGTNEFRFEEQSSYGER